MPGAGFTLHSMTLRERRYWCEDLDAMVRVRFSCGSYGHSDFWIVDQLQFATGQSMVTYGKQFDDPDEAQRAYRHLTAGRKPVLFASMDEFLDSLNGPVYKGD